MKIYIPWIISRRRFFFAIFIDYCINSFLYTQRFINEYSVYPNPIVTISISIFWIILSYILGRYMICKKICREEIIKTIFKALFIFTCCNIVYLIINWSKNILFILFADGDITINVQNSQNIFFIKTTVIITIISGIIQFFLSILTSKIYDNKKSWLFYGSQKGFKDFKKEIGLKNNFQFKRIRSNGISKS